ncbi:hypothetical protein [Amycolatopsis sp. NPDC004625]|uniref:hypothetical protein n=1 Tax=Amycolatopsis sp. NPDC004625 TaxID=3154670 RepID=UPI0033AD237B
MKEFENALAAAFGVDRAEPPALTIDQLDGRLPGSAAVRASTCVTRAEAAPASACFCRADHTEPVMATVCLCRAEPAAAVLATVCRAEPVGTCFCRAEPVLAQA